MLRSAALLLPLLQLSRVRAMVDMDLTPETFDTAIFRSNMSAAFIEFRTTNCAGCILMDEAWENIGEEHEESKSLLIGRVDCDTTQPDKISMKTKQGTWSKLLCDRYNVRSFPTMLYFLPPLEQPDMYYGDNSLANLTAFARSLSDAVACPADALDTCTEAQQAELKEYAELPDQELEQLTGELKYRLEMANYEQLKSERELSVEGEKLKKKRKAKLEKVAADNRAELRDLFATFSHRFLLMRAVQASRQEPPPPPPPKKRMVSTKLPERRVEEHEEKPKLPKLTKEQNAEMAAEMRKITSEMFGGKDPSELPWGDVVSHMQALDSGDASGLKDIGPEARGLLNQVLGNGVDAATEALRARGDAKMEL